jgi:hypothetical protein
MVARLAVAFALALAATAAPAGEAVRPLRGESDVAFRCRAEHVPAARRCAARCDAVLSDSEDARWECVHACTSKGLRAMAQCRGAGGAVTGGALAAR